MTAPDPYWDPDEWLSSEWPLALPPRCECIYADGDVVEFYPEHCPIHKDSSEDERGAA